MGTTGQSITLANSIIGVGILAMPFCFQQCGVVLATLILIFMGLISRLCCYFLLKSALISRRRNFEFLAFHVFGPAGKLAVELGIIGFLMGTCIAYFVVVGDLGPQIVSKMFNINQSDILRTSIMIIVSLVCVLPLGLLRNVDSLSNVSAATIGFYFCLVIKLTAEAASKLPSGEWYHNMEMWQPAGVLQCVPIFSMALFCQTQLFEIFESLPSLSMEKMNIVTKNAINICTCVYFTLGVFGYIAFSSQKISGNILMSLSPTMTSDVIKLGFVMSLAFSFPLIIFPCRASLYSLLYKKVHSSQHDHIINHSIPETSFRCITVGIVFVSLCISLLIPDIELVLGLVGSTIGVLICVVFPTACFVNVTFKNTNERLLAKAVLILGLIIMVLGTFANLQAAEDQLDKYDERFITKERIDKIVEDFFEKRGERLNGEYQKELPKNDQIQFEAQKPNNMIVKDSEVQPPNPVPPESHSNEVKSHGALNNGDKTGNDKLLNEVLLPEKEKEDEAIDKISETHPKNLKTKTEEAKLTIEDSVDKTPEKQVKVNEEIKVEKIKLEKQEKLIETMKQHGEEQKQLMQEQKEIMSEIIKNKKEAKVEPSADAKVETPAKNEPSLANVEANNAEKENQLLETIKQHGKEQKEILNEIIKTKNEYEKNKEEENNEAKKIAVESIKQIANMAIKSIGSVTEKPEDDKKAERLEKLTNEAVQKIAKKAVETIEAIKDIKNPEDANPKPKPVEELKPESKTVEVNMKLNDKPKAAEGNIKSKDTQKTAEDIMKPKDTPKTAEGIMKPKDTPKTAEVNIKSQDKLNEANQKEPIIPKPVEEINQNIRMKPSPKQIADYVNNKPIQNIETNEKLPEKNHASKEKTGQIKRHSHSPDEPESYKEGEDLQNNEMIQNILVPLALKKLKEIREKLQKSGENENAIPKANDDTDSKNGHRQKREVVDCTNRLSLDPLDKNICDSLLNPKLNKQNDVLPKVDLGNGLARMPLDPMHRIGRSLQNYDENERNE